MKNEDALAYWQALKRIFTQHVCHEKSNIKKQNYQMFVDAIDAAISALRSDLYGKPLKREQLKEHNNRPYWNVGLKEGDSAVYCNFNPAILVSSETSGYGRDWLAYVNPIYCIDENKWKPCFRCHWDYPLFKKRQNINAFIDNEYLIVTDGKKIITQTMIDFCPWCGRSLVDDSEDNLDSNELISIPNEIEKLCKTIGVLVYIGTEDFTIKYSKGHITCNAEISENEGKK